MLYNGLCLVVEGALARLPEGPAHDHRDALLLGALREDVWVLPGPLVVEHLSLTHQTGRLPGGFVPFVVPSPHLRIGWLAARARRWRRGGDELRAWVATGRALHLVADLACPAHVSRTVHLRDPYEGWVEAHGQALVGAPPLEVPTGPLRALTLALARRARAFPADGTTSPWGAALARVGVRRPLGADEVGAQARELLPHAMATGAAVIRRVLQA